MNTALAVFSAIGGLSALATGVSLTLRAIFKQVSATDRNTSATESLTKAVGELGEKFTDLDRRVVILEDHDKGRRNGVRSGS